jgi:hypothetical protein
MEIIMRPDWQMRVIEESEALDEKILKLELFIPTQKFAELDEVEQARLTRQLNFMRGYSAVLLERIVAFPPVEEDEVVVTEVEEKTEIVTDAVTGEVVEMAASNTTFRVKPPIPQNTQQD